MAKHATGRMIGQTLQLPDILQKNIVAYVDSCWRRFDIASRRQYYEKIDKALQLESDTRRNLANRKDQRLDYYDDTEVAVATQAVDTIRGFLVDLFLSRPQILQAVAEGPTGLEVAKQIDAINERDSSDYAWARHLNLAFGDLAKYNKTALEVEWDTLILQNLQQDTSGGQMRRKVVEQVRSGNKLRRLDIYNLFHDTLVEPADVHRYGEFCGYTERISMVELIRRVRTLKATNRVVMNYQSCFKANIGPEHNKHYKPSIVPEAPSRESAGWGGFFNSEAGLLKEAPDAKPTNEYLWTCLYTRMVPSMYGITGIPEADKLGIYRIYLVGDTLVCMERMTNIHNYFGIIISMIKEEGIGEQVKSDAALVIPLQNLATKLYDARLTSLARSAANKFAYIEGAVDQASLSHPSAPVRVKPNSLIKDPLQAVKQLPYDDRLGATFNNEIGFIQQQASQITRMNRVQMGQFQKGNKTLGEFNEVMNNADSELRTAGLMFENSVMAPMKEIIKANIAQFQEPDEIATRSNGQVTVNPLNLSLGVINFVLADGLARKENIANLDALTLAYQNMLQNPLLAQQFDIAGMFSYLMELGGAKVNQFRMQQPQQQPQAPAGGPVVPGQGQMPQQNTGA